MGGIIRWLNLKGNAFHRHKNKLILRLLNFEKHQLVTEN